MRKFLTAFAAVAAGFASQNSPAAVAGASSPIASALQNETVNEALKAEDGIVSVIDEKGDEFSFVLKRSSETGVMMAYHSSHSSHRSHSSHSSHYSSR